MTEPMAAADDCEHHYQSRILGGHPLHVRACYFCRQPDWDDLMEQADELYRWGWQEGRAGKPAREALSAYDKPQPDPHGMQEAGRAWMDDRLSSKDYFDLIRRGNPPATPRLTALDRLRQWLRRRKG